MTEVDVFLNDLDRLAATADPDAPDDFYGALLPTAAAALGADAADFTPLLASPRKTSASVWPADQRDGPGLLSPDRVTRLGADGAPRIVAPTDDNPDAGPVIACPVQGARGAEGVLAFRLGIDGAATAERRLQLASAVGEVAERFELRRAAAALRAGQERLRRVEDLLLRLHSRRGKAAIAREAAEEGRRLVGCDRLSVLGRSGGAWRLLAASGVNRPSRRSDAARQMGRLAAAATKLGEPLVYPREEPLPPQVAAEVDRHVDATSTRSLCVWPCQPTSRDDDSQNAAPAELALLAEWFDARSDPEALATLAAIGSHVGVASRRERGVLGWLGGLPRAMAWGSLALLVAAAAAYVAMLPSTLWVTVEGRFEPAERARVFAPLDGVIEEVLVGQADRVTAGQPLVRLASAELRIRQEEVAEAIAVSKSELTSLETAKLRSSLPGQDDALDPTSLASRAAALRQRLDHQRQRRELLSGQAERLLVTSPIAGTVVSWRPEDYLADRPVRRGQRLLEIAGEEAWRIELEAPDHRSGHLLRANREQDEPLRVEYVVRADPSETHTGRVVSLAEATRTNADGQPVVRVVASPDGSGALSPRSGLGVVAKIDCGTQPLLYVWLHEAIEAIQRRLF